jgi:hypothetical protein
MKKKWRMHYTNHDQIEGEEWHTTKEEAEYAEHVCKILYNFETEVYHVGSEKRKPN